MKDRGIKYTDEQAQEAINLIGLLVEHAAEDDVIVTGLSNLGLAEIYIGMVELYDAITEEQLGIAEPLDEEGPPEAGD